MALLRNSVATGRFFRLGMEVATLRFRDDADTPSTSKLRPPISRSFAYVPTNLTTPALQSQRDVM